MSLPSGICVVGGSSAGRWTAILVPNWQSMPYTWLLAAPTRRPRPPFRQGIGVHVVGVRCRRRHLRTGTVVRADRRLPMTTRRWKRVWSTIKREVAWMRGRASTSKPGTRPSCICSNTSRCSTTANPTKPREHQSVHENGEAHSSDEASPVVVVVGESAAEAADLFGEHVGVLDLPVGFTSLRGSGGTSGRSTRARDRSGQRDRFGDHTFVRHGRNRAVERFDPWRGERADRVLVAGSVVGIVGVEALDAIRGAGDAARPTTRSIAAGRGSADRVRLFSDPGTSAFAARHSTGTAGWSARGR